MAHGNGACLVPCSHPSPYKYEATYEGGDEDNSSHRSSDHVIYRTISFFLALADFVGAGRGLGSVRRARRAGVICLRVGSVGANRAGGLLLQKEAVARLALNELVNELIES